MQIGDLPRASTPAGSRGNLSVWAFVFFLAGSVFVAGSLALSSTEQSGSDVEVAKEQTERVARGWSQPAPAQNRMPRAPVQVANAAADPIEIFDIAPDEPDMSFDDAPAHTGSSIPAPPPEPLVKPVAPPPAAAAVPVRTEPVQARPQPAPAPAKAEPKPAPAKVAAAPDPAPAARRSPTKTLVNLNSASVKELNSLRGGGLIGKAIVRRRPYSSVEDLLKKRVLSRSAYNRIKDQVTVR